MIGRLRVALMAGWMAMAAGPLAMAGDYDQALFVLSQAFPDVKSVGVFYDDKGTVFNLLEFEGSAFKEFGLGIKLVPLDAKQRLTHESIRKLCNQHRLQAVLLLEGDSLVKPGSTAGRAIVNGAGHLPVAGIELAWLADGSWFVVGPATKGLQIGPKVRDAKVKEALRLAGEALVKKDG